MVKIRIQGKPEEVKKFASDLKKNYQVLSESDPYPNRKSEYVRVYIELEQNDESLGKS